MLFFLCVFSCDLFSLVVASDHEGIFDQTPTVWRKISDGATATIHLELQQKLKVAAPTGNHNRAVAKVVIVRPEGEQAIDFPLGTFFPCYVSNHAYLYDEKLTEERTDEEAQELKRPREAATAGGSGFEEDEGRRPTRCGNRDDLYAMSKDQAEGEFKAARTAVPDGFGKKLKTGMPTSTESDLDKVKQECDAEIVRLTEVRKKATNLGKFRCIEAQYQKFFPFSKTHKNRMLDSEVSLCREIDFWLAKSEIYTGAAEINIHIYSDNNPCFCCVQTIHYFAKNWVMKTGVPLRVFVSSEKEYVWSGSLPHGHVVPVNAASGKPSMREYGKDDSYDKPLCEKEQLSFTYTKDNVGKVIQLFMPVVEPQP